MMLTPHHPLVQQILLSQPQLNQSTDLSTTAAPMPPNAVAPPRNSSAPSEEFLALEFNWGAPSERVSVCWVCVYSAMFVLGIALNGCAIWKLRLRKKNEREQPQIGTGLCLYAIAVADLCALVALFLLFLASAVSLPNADLANGLPSLGDITCKVSTLVGHASYTQSMWCWCFISVMRYMATRRPLQYLAIWRLPHMAVSGGLSCSLLLQGWLLYGVHYAPSGGGCVRRFSVADRVHGSLDVALSFLVPLLCLFMMDVCVLCRRKRHADPMLQIVINRPNGERKRTFHRFTLIVLTSSIIMNLPGNVSRLLVAVGVVHQSDVPELVSRLFQALQIAQFAFNAIYLSSFLHERSQFSKSNSSRQLSISIRQRLEDGGPHFIRERASTISYRANTPTPPQVKTASSCCAIDFLCPPSGSRRPSWV